MAKSNPLRAALVKSAKPTRFDDAEGKKPNPSGLYNRDGFMDRVPGKASSFTKQAAPPTKPAQIAEMEKAANYDKMLTARRKGKK